MKKSLSNETKTLMSESHKGKHHSTETKNKISKSNTGKKRSKQTRNNISNATKGKKHKFSKRPNRKINKIIKCNYEEYNYIFDINNWRKYNINEDNLIDYLNFIIGIINEGKRDLEYFEKHHIIPKSIDSSFINDKNNIVCLSAKEHYIAHEKLVYVFNGKQQISMSYALHRMSYSNSTTKYIPTGEEYELMKLIFSKTISEISSRPRSEEWKNNISIKFTGEGNPFFGRHHTEYTKNLISVANKGRTPWNKGMKMPPEFGIKVGLSNIGSKRPNRSINSAHRGTIWVKKDNICKRIYSSQLKYYLELGYDKGKIYHEENPKPRVRSEETNRKCSEKLTGRVFMTNGITNIMVEPEKIKEKESEGFWIGRTSKKRGKSNKKCMNKDGNNMHVPIDKIDEYIADGWELGEVKNITKTVAVNNGYVCIKIEPELLEEYQSKGFEKGFIKSGNAGKMTYVTNGIIEKRILKEELDKYLADGFIKGRLQYNRISVTI